MRMIQPSIETSITRQYEKYHVTTPVRLIEMFEKDQPRIGVMDSETTGLHIKKDRPFLWVFGWLLPKNQQTEHLKGRVFSFEHSPEMVKTMLILAKQLKMFVGHNVKFDFHMLENATGYQNMIKRLDNVTDSMSLFRLIAESVSPRDGGDHLSLKEIALKYIDPQAKQFESVVKKELKRINDERRKVLITLLKPYKGWGIGKIKKVFRVMKRGEVDIYTLERKQRWVEVPEEVYQIYADWIDEYPSATYADVPLDVMIDYVHSDGIYTLELTQRAIPRVVAREQVPILKQERKLLPILYRQERFGMRVNLEYLRTSRDKLDREIDRCYRELWELSGRYFTVSQDDVIKDIYEEATGKRPRNTDSAFLKKQKGDRIAQLIRRLRRLEKWLSTYVYRILEVAEYDGRFYTQINPYGTVSGRSTSDAQQFPKERILTEEGEAYEKEHGELTAPEEMELFYPRRAFIPEGNGYNTDAYLDYSQIELRVQANYTLLMGRPDMNLCRAYMPLNCRHYKTGEVYDYSDPAQRKRWNERQEDGQTSAWLLEDGSPWKPTDVHSETTHNALLALQYECQEKYKSYTHSERSPIDTRAFDDIWRKRGKTFNFMRNYGGGAAKAAETLDVDMEVANALVTGWSRSFPEVAHYQNKVIQRVRQQGFATNMYGRRYYLSNPDFAYKIGNYLVQGSSADFLKQAMIKIEEFLEKNNLKTQMVINIHDEIKFAVWEGEEWVIDEIAKIMEECDWMLVPVKVGVEVTKTNWAEAI